MNRNIIWNKTLNFFFPPKCLSCSAKVTEMGSFCINCWQRLKFITKPSCDICDYPFEYKMIGKNICGSCAKYRPHFSRNTSLLVFDEYSKSLIHKMKYEDKTMLAPYLAKFLYHKIQNNNLFDKTSDDKIIIAPIPIHTKKLKIRGYNQSLLLSKHLSKLLGKEIIYDLLFKSHNTGSQTGLTKIQRFKNIKNSFALSPKYKDFIKDKLVLLVDDVMTSGATINECSRILNISGALRVESITIARTIID